MRLFAAGTALSGLAGASTLFRVRDTRPPHGGDEAIGYLAILARPQSRRLYLAVGIEGTSVCWRTGASGSTTHKSGCCSRATAWAASAGGLLLSRAAAQLGERALLRTGGGLLGGAFVSLSPGLPWTAFAAALVVLGVGFAWLHATLQRRATGLVPAARGHLPAGTRDHRRGARGDRRVHRRAGDGYFENSRVKKSRTLWPKATAPSFVLSQALFACGSAAWPDSFSFSPVYLPPSTTV